MVGRATLYEVTGESPQAINSFEEPENVKRVTREIEASGRELTVELAPCTVNVLKVRVGA